jgi:hypothetical protein
METKGVTRPTAAAWALILMAAVLALAGAAASFLLGDEGKRAPAVPEAGIDLRHDIETGVPTTAAVPAGAELVTCPGEARAPGGLRHVVCYKGADGRTMSVGWMPAP